MKTIDQLAESAYAAYCKKSDQVSGEPHPLPWLPWHEVDALTRACWVAVATQMAAEIAAMSATPSAHTPG